MATTAEITEVESAEWLDEKDRGLLRQSLDLLKKRTEKLIGDLAAVRLPDDEAQTLLSDISEVRSMVAAMATRRSLSRAHAGCIAAALGTYLDELAKTQKSEEKIGVSINATEARRFEIGHLAVRLGVLIPPSD